MVGGVDGFLSRCAAFLVGGGRSQATPDGARLILPSASSSRYSDAQLDDYAGLPRQRYPHRPPLRLTLRARFSHNVDSNHDNLDVKLASQQPARAYGSLLGTAGFGFWNNPFGAQSTVPALPQAIWFFCASPPSDMRLATGAPGYGWKAACIDASQWSALAWAPVAPLVMLACRSARLYRALWPHVQHALGIRESPLTFREGDMTDWHTYELEWRRDGARWWVDGGIVLETDRSPRGPLGFVAWIDNQYAVVTPQGRFAFGLLDAPFEEWVEVSGLSVKREA